MSLRLSKQRGFTMLEILVSLLLIVFGLLGMLGLQAQATVAEFESYQRGQALVLAQDMVDRINANRKNAASYVTASALGTSSQDCSVLTALADQSLSERLKMSPSTDRYWPPVEAMPLSAGAWGCPPYCRGPPA